MLEDFNLAQWFNLFEALLWCGFSTVFAIGCVRSPDHKHRRLLGEFMDERDFEGTLVLEKMAEINRLEEFFDAIDADDFPQVKNLMKRARLDAETIEMVLKKMNDPGNH